MLVLGIESSCDETAAAVINNGKMRSNVIASQIAIHSPYGGVVPEHAPENTLRRSIRSFAGLCVTPM